MDSKRQAVTVIRNMMSELETDVSTRNTTMNDRYNVVYKGGIMAGLRIRAGHDMTQYNYLGRVVEIHSAKLFGRMPAIVTKYDTENINLYNLGVTNPEEAATDKEKAKLRNQRRATDNEIRNNTIKAIIEDNRMEELLNRAAHIGSWSGVSIIKGWVDKEAKTYRFSLIEQPQNFMRYWANSNFRDSEADFFAYQISQSSAYRQYGDKLGDNESFSSSTGNYWWKADEADDLSKKAIKKVWVVDATGYFPGITTDGKGNLKECAKGKETKVNVLIVGDVVVQVVDKDVPTYWVVNNDEIAGKPWGSPDISDELISVNRTMIETMSDWRTASWKVTFPKLKFMGYDEMDLPAIDERTSFGVAVGEGQDIQPLHLENTLQEFPRLMQELWNSFTKLSKVSRVMLDDPTVDAVSNQALMTTMGGLVDVTEGKQKRWAPKLVDMFETALKAVAQFDETLAEAVNEHDFRVAVKWASYFRREDPSYWQMLLNLWNAGVLSPESYLESMSFDAEDEIDRMRDAMEDPVRSAMIGHTLNQMSLMTAQKSQPMPPMEQGVPMSPDALPQQANPTLTPDQNTGQSASMPGSGAPAVSAEGAIAQAQQQQGI